MGAPRVATGWRRSWPGWGGCWGRGRSPASPSDGPDAQGGCPPPPRHWGVAGEGRGSRSGRPSPRGGSPAQVRRRPRDLGDLGVPVAGGPRAAASPSPVGGRLRGGAPNFWPGSAGVRGVKGQTTKATAGPARVPTRGTEGSAGSATPLRLPPPGTSSGCAARLGEGGRGRRGESLARWPAGALCSARLGLLRAGPQPPGCGPS